MYVCVCICKYVLYKHVCMHFYFCSFVQLQVSYRFGHIVVVGLSLSPEYAIFVHFNFAFIFFYEHTCIHMYVIKNCYALIYTRATHVSSHGNINTIKKRLIHTQIQKNKKLAQIYTK